MRIINPNRRTPATDALTAAVTAFMQDKEQADFTALRAAIPALLDAPDGAVHQAALDAGFEVALN